jgi:hypothetical protein
MEFKKSLKVKLETRVMGPAILYAKSDRRLQLQAGGLSLDATDDGLGGVLGDDLVIVEHGEF